MKRASLSRGSPVYFFAHPNPQTVNPLTIPPRGMSPEHHLSPPHDDSFEVIAQTHQRNDSCIFCFERNM